MSTSVPGIRYITDHKGKRREVVLPYEYWKKIEEELAVYREKQEILEGLRQGIREVKPHQAGKIHLGTLRELIDELRDHSKRGTHAP